LGVKIYSFTNGTSVPLPPGLVGCILTGKTDRIVYTWVAELVFDTAIFLFTLYRTLEIYRQYRGGAAIPLITIMLRDGIVYFAVIFAANVVTVTLFLALPTDLKVVNASFSTLITSLMVSRLILNLRSQALRPSATTSYPSHASLRPLTDRSSLSHAYISPAIIGNLGEPVSGWFDDEEEKDAELFERHMDAATRASYYEEGPMYELSETTLSRRPTHARAPSRPQILVEVTRDVVSDSWTPTSQRQRYFHVQGPRDRTDTRRSLRMAPAPLADWRADGRRNGIAGLPPRNRPDEDGARTDVR